MATNASGVVRVLLDTYPKTDLELLRHAAISHFPTASEVYITPTIRLGQSGTRVYKVRARLQNQLLSQFFYAKVGNAEKLAYEHNAYKSFVHGHLFGAPETWFTTGLGGAHGDGCLCCFSATADFGSEPLPMADVLGDSKCDLESPLNAISYVYEQILHTWIEATSRTEISWLHEYEWYLRRDRTEALVWRCWPQLCGSQRSVVAGRELVSPLWLLEVMASEGWKDVVYRRPVHGDLHQRNIILSRIGTSVHPFLIDFGWTRQLHSLVDYTLLEASLKIFFYQRYLSDERVLAIHDMFALSDLSLEGIAEHERALVLLVSQIRAAARREMDETSWPREYYLSSFLVTLGLSSVPTSHVWLSYLVSSWFATELMRSLGRLNK